MARVNITVADDLIARARAAGINVSAVAAAGLASELENLDKIAELDRYMAELEAEYGPIPQEELDAADERISRAVVVGGDQAETA